MMSRVLGSRLGGFWELGLREGTCEDAVTTSSDLATALLTTSEIVIL
jgi:hypothetical protein